MNLAMLAVISQIVGALLFVVLAVVLARKYLVGAIAAYTAAKNAEVRESELRREHMLADVQAAQGEVGTAELDATEIESRGQAMAVRERAAALDAARHEAERLVHNAEGELERARLAARDRLRIEIIEHALRQARAQAPSRVDAATHRALIDETVRDLVRGAS